MNQFLGLFHERLNFSILMCVVVLSVKRLNDLGVYLSYVEMVHNIMRCLVPWGN